MDAPHKIYRHDDPQLGGQRLHHQGGCGGRGERGGAQQAGGAAGGAAGRGAQQAHVGHQARGQDMCQADM